jgi:hypothetical protein
MLFSAIEADCLTNVAGPMISPECRIGAFGVKSVIWPGLSVANDPT